MKLTLKHTLSVCILFLFVVSLSDAQMRRRKRANPFKNFKEAKSFLKQEAQKNKFSGNVLVKNNHTTFLEDSFGLADKEKKIANNIDTKISIGSINKVFTSVSVMQLVDKGTIKLSDKVVTYIPELRMPMAEEITILHLLQMRSGLGSYFSAPYFQNNHRKLKNMEDYIPVITSLTLDSKPGAEFQYSNAGYELLGILVQRVSGQNYYDYVREYVYKKAGMTHTDSYERDKATHNLAQSYTNLNPGDPIGRTKEGNYIQNTNEWHAVKGTAAGGGYSTLADLNKFLVALNGNKLISKKSTDLVINKFRPNFKERKNVFNFRGGSYGINAVISYNIEKATSVIVISNYDPPTASSVADRLIETVKQS